MGSVFGKNLKLTIFGESHGAGVGAVINGFPAGVLIDEVAIRRELDRRRPGQNAWSTPRTESDLPQVISGIYKGHSTGTPIAVLFKNQDTRSGDYENIEIHDRPSHGDYTGRIKYKGFNDPRGGGHFSGRLTTGMVYAGSLAKQLLAGQYGITIRGHLSQVGSVKDMSIEKAISEGKLLAGDFPMFDEESALAAARLIEETRKNGDSIGAKVTVAAVGMPVGCGNPIFENLESQISSALFSVPGVKGVSFGAGFEVVEMYGSNGNDRFISQNGKVMTASNHSGGINGGISNGMPIVVHAALRGTPSIGIAQETLRGNGEMGKLIIKGRHDPCIGPRALPVIEGMLAFAILDSLLSEEK